MKKKIWLSVWISLCCIMIGCGGSEMSSETDGIEQEVLEQGESMGMPEQGKEPMETEINEGNTPEYEKSDLTVLETEETQAEEYGEEMSEPANTELEAFQAEMYDEWAEYLKQEKAEGEAADTGEEVVYQAENYGEIQEYGSEFYFEEDKMGFYYNMETFYLGSDFLYTMNDTLQEFYDGYLKQYQETEDWYMEEGEQELPEGKVPYSELIFLGIEHIDNDYVSLLFNDVSSMGGARAYSRFDAITVDRHTGKEVTASEILGESDTELLAKVSNLMGLDIIADWEDIDFYLEDGTIVFFYRLQGYFEDVVLAR